ncbi:MAG: hypothetical protein KatS3mg095_0158 [Candidatus Parcubacteria bacterium]|nr:MAG: hypothetical protein KatS3mg095_0158 [Candidatus Parcubacteria bacterium]
MERAYNFLKIIFILISLIYILGFTISDDLLITTMKSIGSKLSPYVIEILHLR